MTDIAKRLRHQYAIANELDAADEIERLRDALEHIASYPIPRPYFGKGGAIIPESMRDIARAALEESK